MRRSAYHFHIVCAFTLIAGVALAAGGKDDHPLVTRYEGSIVDSKTFAQFGEYQLATGYTEQGGISGESLRGKLTRIVYLVAR